MYRISSITPDAASGTTNSGFIELGQRTQLLMQVARTPGGVMEEQRRGERGAP